MALWAEDERVCSRGTLNLEKYIWNEVVHADGSETERSSLCIW